MKLKTIFYSIVVLLSLFFVFTIGKTIFLVQKINNNNSTKIAVPQPSKEALERYSGGLKIQTISNSKYDKTNFVAFDEFINYLKKTYPLLFTKAEFTVVNNYNLIFKIKGQNDSLKPNLLTAHYDVVGVKDNTNWIHPPFSGYYNDEFILSRGTLDDKSSFFAILEAANDLLKKDFTPQADLYLAFSHCEETGSPNGAKKIVEYFLSEKIIFSTALDEGGRVINKNGTDFAFVGTAEKGRLLVKITTLGVGKHASTPDNNPATKKLAKLIQEFSSKNYKTEMSKEIYQYYLNTINCYNFKTQYLIANKFFFKKLLYKELMKTPEDNARINTTFAITMLEASNTANVISNDATLTMDIRILPPHKINDLKQYVESIIYKNLSVNEVKIEYLDSIPPCDASPIGTEEYSMLKEDIHALYPNIKIAPYMVLGATDARDYAKIADNTYRFLPIVLTDEEASLMHADNEKISLVNWARMIEFYKTFIGRR